MADDRGDDAGGDTGDDPTTGGGGRSWPVVLGMFAAMVVVLGTMVAATRPGGSNRPLPATGTGDGLDSYAVAGPPVEGAVAPPVCRPGRSGAFRLAFYDDFNGTGPDPTWWTAYDSPGNGGFGLRRPAALSSASGVLTITARMAGSTLVSGGMESQLPLTYGRWEVRVRTDPDPSGATSGVVLTWPTSGRWPVDGETDIYETGPQAVRRPFSSFVHYGQANDQEEISHDADGSAWHDMAMEWTPDLISLYRDGELAGLVTRQAAIARTPHQLTIQLDAWAPAMGDPVTMQVDWVHVYRWQPGGVC